RRKRCGTAPASYARGGHYEPHTVHCPVASHPWRVADLAVQLRLGLLSERWARPDPAAPDRPGTYTDCAIALVPSGWRASRRLFSELDLLRGACVRAPGPARLRAPLR